VKLVIFVVRVMQMVNASQLDRKKLIILQISKEATLTTIHTLILTTQGEEIIQTSVGVATRTRMLLSQTNKLLLLPTINRKLPVL
jgi:hypothetical protein